MRNRCRNFGGVRAFMKTRPALFLHVLGCVLMRGPGRMTQVSVCDWVHVCQIFHFYFILVIDSPFLVKKTISFQQKSHTSFSILEKSLPTSKPLVNPAFPAEARAHGMFSAIPVCCVLLPLGVPVGLTSIWAASTNTPRALNPLMGNPRVVRGRKG